MEHGSGVGVIDKSVALLAVLAEGPAPLNELASRSGIPRPTTHRLAVALEHHGLLDRDDAGRFMLGPRILEFARAEDNEALSEVAQPHLDRLRSLTGESTQLYIRRDDRRICLAVSESTRGLRDTVPVGATLSLAAGSAAQVLLAWTDLADAAPYLSGAAFDASTLTRVRHQGWAASVAEREEGVASVSAPVFDGNAALVAAISVSGPIDRLTRQPGRVHAAAVQQVATDLSAAVAVSRSPTAR